MTEQPAIVQEIWQILRENAEQLRLMREQSLQEAANTRAEMQALVERFKETDARFDAMVKENESRFKETDAQFKETDAKLKLATKNVDALTGKWEKFVESLIVPAAESLFAERGIPVHSVSQRVRGRKNGHAMEIDIFVRNEHHVVLIEVKSTLSVDDVHEPVERLAAFKSFFPEYADRQVLGAVAGIEITGGADNYAYHQG